MFRGGYKEFVDSCYTGVCLVGDDNKIKYLNPRGLGFLKWSDLSHVKDTEVTDVFIINELNRQKFLDKGMKRDSSLEPVKVVTSEGVAASMDSHIIFTQGPGGIYISGIMFQPTKG